MATGARWWRAYAGWPAMKKLEYVDELMIEISGREHKVEAFIERMRGYGITELVRSGRIAMIRSCGGARPSTIRT